MARQASAVFWTTVRAYSRYKRKSMKRSIDQRRREAAKAKYGGGCGRDKRAK